MRSIHVIPAINIQASGPTYSVSRLCEEIIRQGYGVNLAVMEPIPGFQKEFVKGFPSLPGLRRIGVSPRMLRWLREQVSLPDVNIVHGHGLWTEINVYPSISSSGAGKICVISPRGTLAAPALEVSKWRKKILWSVFVGRAARGVTAFHATSWQEYRDIRHAGFDQPVAIIPNGVDIPDLRKKIRVRRRRLLFLGRLHPIKGIDLLLRAWADLQGRHPDWDLIIAGPDEKGYGCKLRALAAELRLERVSFVGALYGEEKIEAYSNSDLYVLPTHSENFGMTIAEALAAGTPVITTKGAPWSGLEVEGAGWWVENNQGALFAALDEALKEPIGSLAARGRRGRDWMIRDFGWDAIAADMQKFYAWLEQGGEPPNFVHID
ncbi:glycosyltransferase [Amorphus coralli]|uniref:glycosyltransferase n=1 Tax=Amorphus coralli TaxID=340680 RepID=UPI0009FF6311|nr:glycosyltransferase [Amorphus coralli]